MEIIEMNCGVTKVRFMVLQQKYTGEIYVNVFDIAKFEYLHYNDCLRLYNSNGEHTDVEVASMDDFLKHLDKALNSDVVVVYP